MASTKDMIDAYEDIVSCFCGYDSAGTQTFTTTAVTLNIDATHISDPIYSLSNDELTINDNGTFEISYDAALIVTSGNGRSEVRTWLERDTVELAGTSAEIYVRQADFGGTASCRIILSVTSGEVFRIRAVRTQGTSTIGTTDNGVRLTVNRIR